jgi:hypothetical protein
MADEHMAKLEPSPDYDPDDYAYDHESEPDQTAWPEEDAYWYDLDEPVMDDPLAFNDEHMARLGLTLDFGPGDLACNRDGELSPAQIARLETDLRLFYWPMIAVLSLIAFLIGVMGAINGQLSAFFPALLLMGLAAIPALLLNRERQRLPTRLVLHTTLRLGGLSLTVRRWGLNDEGTLPVDGGKPVFGPKHVYKVLRANQTYLAHYAPVRTWRGYRLLSLEPMGSAPGKPKRKAKGKRRG